MKQPIVFAYWVNNQLMGFRADTFGTISTNLPKIYHYSKEQVNTVIDNTNYLVLNLGGSGLIDSINKNTTVIGREGGEVKKDFIRERLSQNELLIRSWGDFELRVHPFIDYEWHDHEVGGEIIKYPSYPEKWKVEAEIKSLRDAIEVHKFKTLDNEN